MLQIIPNGFFLNSVLQDKLLGRTSFKLSNIVTYHYTGQGGGKYSLGAARRWVEHNQAIFGENVVLRVFLESEDWAECDDCMFGSEPRDQGFWNVEQLKDNVREKKVHAVGAKVLEWFFKTSEETGVAFELVIDSTLKGTNGIPPGEIDHVIRVVGILMGELSLKYPRALIIPNARNEWNAHNRAGHTLGQVNMWANRWERDQYWPGSQPIVCPGGNDMYTYAVGQPGSGRFAMGLIHPDRVPKRRSWWELPDLSQLRGKSDGMPIGFNESMFLVESEDLQRAERWYKHRRRWTDDWSHYERFMTSAIDGVNYFVIHDEKGIQCDIDWPRKLTRVEKYFKRGPDIILPPPKEEPVDNKGIDLDKIIEILVNIDPEQLQKILKCIDKDAIVSILTSVNKSYAFFSDREMLLIALLINVIDMSALVEQLQNIIPLFSKIR